MGGFHDVRLPTTFSRDSLFGPGFGTKIVELDNFQEQRVSRVGEGGRRRFNLNRGISSLTDLIALQEFAIARQGAAFSFRVKDWSDYNTSASGINYGPNAADVAFDDVVLQATDTATVYQFVKRYTSGPTTRVRKLTKLVDGTVKVGINGVEQTTGYTVNLLTGLVTFSSDPGTDLVTGGCEFDVPCRFSEDVDEVLQIAIASVNAGNLPAIDVIEDVDPAQFNQEVDFGGFYDHGTMNNADVNITELQGRFQRFAPTTTSLVIILPDASLLPLGGPYFFFSNEGSQDLTIETPEGTTVVGTFATNDTTEIWLGLNASGQKAWYTL